MGVCMIGQSTVYGRSSWQGGREICLAPFVCVLLAASCTKSAVHGAVSMDALPPSMTSQSDDRHDLAGEWEYVDGAVARLTHDAESNGHDDWEDG